VSEKLMGIYKIENIYNKMIYIGSTTDFERRKKQHLNDLKKGVHCNFKLQNDYIRYGQDNFNFFFIREVDNKKLLEYEEALEIEEYLEVITRKYLYNIALVPYEDYNKMLKDKMNYATIEDKGSCKYCNGKQEYNTLLLDINGIFFKRERGFLVFFSGNKLSLMETDDGGASNLDEITINYCPFCGRRILPIENDDGTNFRNLPEDEWPT